MIVTISNKLLIAKINSKGAELISFTKDNFNYIWKIDERYWNKTSPVLFPIVGSLKNNEYTIEDEKYSLTRHGFARDLEFELIEQKEASALFCLKWDELTLKKYPFQFELFINYELTENGLIISYKVINHSKDRMPFNIGAHPAFNLPFNTSEYTLEFNAFETFETHLLENGLFSGVTKKIDRTENTLSLSESLFEKDALVFKNIKSNSVNLKHLEKEYLKISFYNFPHLGIWKKQNASFLCIEPWTGYADDIHSNGNIFDKKDIQILNSNCAFKCNIKIEV